MSMYMSNSVAPSIGDVVPKTPLVSLTLSRSTANEALAVSGLAQGISITLPITDQSLAPPAGQVFAGYYSCVFWDGTAYSSAGCTSSRTAAAGTAQCTCNHLTAFAAIAEYEYPTQSFTLANVAQSSQYTSASNTLTVSLQVSMDIQGSTALPDYYTASGPPHKLIVTGFGDVTLAAGGTLVLKPVSGGNNGHALFCVGSDSNRAAASTDSMTLTLCAGATMTRDVTYVFAFDITNPSAPRPAANLIVSLEGATSLWPASPMQAPGGVNDPLYLVRMHVSLLIHCVCVCVCVLLH